MTTVQDQAARLLSDAARERQHLASLPASVRPGTVAEAHAIQSRIVAMSGLDVVGWKVATNAEGVAMWGAIYRDDCMLSPARIPAGRMPLRGVEGEVAFRFAADLPARIERYSRAEIEAVLAAFPAIEIVDSRFDSYKDTPVLDRLADRMSNGGMVLGAVKADWQSLDLPRLGVVLERKGETVVDQSGGHSRGDPLLPVLDFIWARQHEQHFAAGQFITAGTYTGLIFAEPGEAYAVSFAGLGKVEVTFD